MFKRILIANRGEIACRVIRSCRRLGIESVAVYSSADEHALHVREADRAVAIGAADPADSYLNAGRIIDAAKREKAQAIHPGYGFLAENPDFARDCEDAGLVFIGPAPETIERMGSKAEAKVLMEAAGVPVVPGYHGEGQGDEVLSREARRIAYPLMLKPAAGGGGKGMRIVREEKNFAAALESARREARKAFGDERMILERYIEAPRHIEYQIFGDSHGNLIHLFERECSVQRRYQKIVEETPSPFLDESTRSHMAKAALDAAGAVNYRGAGTVEFIVGADKSYFFMEMNTRLQVEHPVTEMATGLDLVEWQLRVAAGEALPLEQEQVTTSGHAIEARIYAEDPARGFLPASGKLETLIFPETGEHIRIDSGVMQGDTVSVHYDPMIAKLIVHGKNRDEAVARLQQALQQNYIAGPETNLAFLIRLVHTQRFLDAAIDTGYLDRHLDEVLPNHPGLSETALIATAVHWTLSCESQVSNPSGDPFSPWGRHDAWRTGTIATRRLQLAHLEDELSLTIIGSRGEYKLGTDNDLYSIAEARLTDDGVRYRHGSIEVNVTLARLRDGYRVNADMARWHLRVVDPLARAMSKDADEHRITAPMPGRVVSIKTRENAKVNEGDELVVMEAMKMEISLRAPHDGSVARILHGEGDFVEADTALVELE